MKLLMNTIISLQIRNSFHFFLSQLNDKTMIINIYYKDDHHFSMFTSYYMMSSTSI